MTEDSEEPLVSAFLPPVGNEYLRRLDDRLVKALLGSREEDSELTLDYGLLLSPGWDDEARLAAELQVSELLDTVVGIKSSPGDFTSSTRCDSPPSPRLIESLTHLERF